jgi:putative hydrolase of the HAD superfamily
MPSSYSAVLKPLCRPLSPIPVSEKPRLHHLEGVRAVLFDVYGTLFISGSGEIGTSGEAGCETAFAAALEAVRLRFSGTPGDGLQLLFDRIEAIHAIAHERGIQYPEVDIVEVWRWVVAEMADRGLVAWEPTDPVDFRRLAIEYEARANPVWPMPGLTDCLEYLRSHGLAMGIISNAQFYTREIFPALLGQPAESFGFDPQLLYYSYEHGVAKPGTELYRMAAKSLGIRGIAPGEVLYVGNDMLNDIMPAVQVGFRGGLFAGDGRSLRRRHGDPRVSGVSPEVILTSLSDLKMCFPV